MTESINKNDVEGLAEETRSTGLQRKMNRVDVVIHTMPKRFLHHSSQSSNSGRHIGLYIILVGTFVLLVVLGFLYLYLSNPPESKVVVNSNSVSPQQNSAEANLENAELLEKTPVQSEPAEETEDDQVKEYVDEKSLIPAETATATTIVYEEEDESETGTGTSEIIFTDTEIIEPMILSAAPDTDDDGLTDIEELVLDTNPRSGDSDGDGYPDLDEFAKLYNPAGAGKIIVNPNIDKYTNSEYAYAIYYPKSWIINNALGNNSVVFQLGGDEFIQIIIEPKFEEASLEDWYKGQFKTDLINSSQKVFKPGWAGIKNSDNLIYYLFNPNHEYLVVVSYSPGSDSLKYQKIFEMMIASLEFIN